MARIMESDLDDDVPRLIATRITKAKISKVFDVGANIGWVTHQFLKAMPEVIVHAFEPVPSTMIDMKENLQRFPGFERIIFEELALGSENGTATITSYPGYTTNHIVKGPHEGPTIDIKVVTGDQYCLDHEIDQLDWLKIDAEGYDLEVICGFEKMLQRNAVNFIQVETGFSGESPMHIPLETFVSHLRPRGFRLMMIKNQASNEVPYLQYADAIFIREAYAHEVA